MRPPRPADHHEHRVGECDQAGDDIANGICEDGPRTLYGGRIAVEQANHRLRVDRRGAVAPQMKCREDFGKRGRTAAWPARHEMGNFAGNAATAPTHLAVADDCAAEALAEIEVREVVQRR